MTALVLDRPTGTEHTPASGTNDRRRELRDRGHQLRAARRRSTLSGLKHASARPACRSHARRAVEATSSQVRSGVYDDSAGGDGGLSCLANGTTKRIDQIREGDYVLATDPETGESGPREVIATLPHIDQLLTLRLSSGEVVTTEDHKYWNATDGEWQESQHLDKGDRLLTADGDEVLVEGLDWSTVHTAAAYDLTIDDLHTFYVGAGDESVLVHNCIRNSHLAGKTHPKTGVPFDAQGYPNFSAWRHPSVSDVRIQLSGNRSTDFARANRAAGLSETPAGYTWHHHQDSGLMQLVDSKVHAATGHTGGFSSGG